MLQYICSYLLFVLGWSKLDYNTINIIKRHRRLVAVIPHTSMFDFIIYLLYRFAYPQLLSHCYTIVKPSAFQYAGWILRRLNCLAATSIQDRNGGNVSKIVDQVKDKEEFLGIISPKGTRTKSQWRTGYFAIAKELNVDICTLGFDYNTQTLKCYNPKKICDTDDLLFQHLLQHDLTYIVPLYPEDEVYGCRPHQSRRVIDITWFLTTQIPLLAILFIYGPMYALLLGVIYCLLFHYT